MLATILMGGAALVAQALPLPAMGAAAQTAPELRVLHWNIAGLSFTPNPFDDTNPDNEGTFQVVDRLLDVADDRQPHLVSMNETCWLQAKYARQQLAERFGSAEIQFADSAGTDVICDGDIFEGRFFESGPALIAVGADGVWDRRTFYFTDDGLITSEQTERAATCMVVSYQSTLGRVFNACTAHLNPTDSIARAQAQTLANVLTQEGAAVPVVLAGDLNAPPDVLREPVYAPEQGGQGSFLEVDYPENQDTFDAGGKIDYVLGDSFGFASAHGGEVIPPGRCPTFPFLDHPCSDHSMLFGRLTFREDIPPTPEPPGPSDGTPPEPPDTPPFVTAGPPVAGDEGSAITLFGSAADDHGPPSLAWSYQPGDAVDAGASCSFSALDRARTTIACTDDGTFTATLTASDGVNDPVVRTTTVTVRNVAPTVELAEPQPWQVYRVGTPVTLTAPFTDPGTNDTHSCTIDWDDTSSDAVAATASTCAGAHVFPTPGMYTIEVTVEDDDGGRGTVLAIVYDPDGGFVTTGAHVDDARFTFNPSYQPHDEGPVATGGRVAVETAGFRLESTSFDWLVATPDGRAAVKGTASLDGTAGYGFVLYAYDDPDALRLVVWSLTEGPIPEGAELVYDTRPGAPLDLDLAEPQAITQGSVQVHQ